MMTYFRELSVDILYYPLPGSPIAKHVFVSAVVYTIQTSLQFDVVDEGILKLECHRRLAVHAVLRERW
jgi:hypothetical protein